MSKKYFMFLLFLLGTCSYALVPGKLISQLPGITALATTLRPVTPAIGSTPATGLHGRAC